MKKESYLTQHQQHRSWLNYLSFYGEEMQIFQKRLEEVAQKDRATEFQAFVEHFQNQFILQREQLDILHHDIREVEKEIEIAYEANPTLAGNRRLETEDALQDRVDTFARLFHEMKDEFYQFVARHL